jgi:prepilin peptidase CpaA
LPTPPFNPALAALAGSGAVSTAIDLRTRRVPNILTSSIAIIGLSMALFGVSGISPAAALFGALVGLALMLPGHLIGGTGAGDVKLFAAAGTLLGPAGIATAFVYTAIAGGVLALAAAARRRRLATTLERTATLVRTAGANVAEIEGHTVDNRFAYAPAIAIGTVAAALGL